MTFTSVDSEDWDQRKDLDAAGPRLVLFSMELLLTLALAIQ